jgi:hypothetical protein
LLKGNTARGLKFGSAALARSQAVWYATSDQLACGENTHLPP